jgi:hypothetical protein
MSNHVRTALPDALPESGAHIDERGARTLAKTLYRMLRARGIHPRHMLQLTTELIALSTNELRDTREQRSL